MSTATVTRLAADYVVPGEGTGRIVADGAIDIDASGRITAVGALSELPAGPPPNRVGGLLMPGLVNAHAHTPMTLVRSVGDGLPLQRWLREGVWPLEANMTADDARWGMLLGSVEMLLAGVTTSCEMYLFEEAMVDAVSETGGRLVVTPGVIAALAPGGNVDPRMAQIVECHRRHHNPNGRVTVGFAPHSIYDLAPAQVAEISAEARSVDALLHIHLEETEQERLEVMNANGGRTADPSAGRPWCPRRSGARRPRRLARRHRSATAGRSRGGCSPLPPVQPEARLRGGSGGCDAGRGDHGGRRHRRTCVQRRPGPLGGTQARTPPRSGNRPAILR